MQLKLVIGNKNYSSWSLRPWLVLKQLGVEFEEILIPLFVGDWRQQIGQYTPAGKVPVLICDHFAIWESLAIMEFLVEQFPEANLLPTDPAARAMNRSIAAEMHAGFINVRTHMPMNGRARYPGMGRTIDVLKEINRITTIWRDCRNRYGSGGDLLFGHFTIADAMYAPVVLRFVTYGVELDPVCQAYLEAVLNLPAMQEWLAAGAIEPYTIANYEYQV
ncbi:Glutathione S-transferase domain protein [Thalassoporum mexicanum PCC 7367]|uniref:glutathione S-transferase family protein n=1 Tax=Thalassoporum mexicanum TaxID=3457544 RepID=UPI00029FED80|nr:glutathione S-transferase family protein [Pseudanabaena sp. PCC 7367]AFY71359.1 Glutathione S-transferase domain protein [Pseudanabaena sp. PCC 7367]